MPLSKIPKALALHSAIIGFLFILLSNTKGDNLKLWDPNNKLTWKDFVDTTLTHSDRAALTNSGIRLDFNQTSQHSITINVFSAMDRDKSWVDRNKKSDYILSHEQYHFNITEYWARKLKKDLSAEHFTTKNLKEKVSSISKDNIAQLHDMQDEYDHDTKHSEIEPEQKRWEKKVDDLLKSVEQYAPTSITVQIK